MKRLKIIGIGFEHLVFMFLFLFSIAALSQTAVVSPSDFLNQVISFIQSWGGLGKLGQVAGLITILISSMNVTALYQNFWVKLGAWQVWVAPIMGLAAGLFGLGMNGAAITPASVFAYVTAGAGAIFIHEMLDSVKELPGISTVMGWVIDILEQFFHGPSSSAPSAIAFRQKKAELLGKKAYDLRTKK